MNFENIIKDNQWFAIFINKCWELELIIGTLIVYVIMFNLKGK
ncbi:hypothetical protein SRABI04_03828 [Chryseobacterium sp. Bi04]|nr:hypothetical protein SRABI04_03828 [Chryseobacterium sp. Bi04]